MTIVGFLFQNMRFFKGYGYTKDTPWWPGAGSWAVEIGKNEIP